MSWRPTLGLFKVGVVLLLSTGITITNTLTTISIAIAFTSTAVLTIIITTIPATIVVVIFNWYYYCHYGSWVLCWGSLQTSMVSGARSCRPLCLWAECDSG